MLLAVGLTLLALTAREFALAHAWAGAEQGAPGIIKDLGFSVTIVALAALVAWIPAVRRTTIRLADWLRNPSPSFQRRAALYLSVAAAIYLTVSAILHQRALFPTLHDEQMYLLQARLLAEGRLWLPPHPVGQFFETFYVLHHPVYAATYFPGTALLHVPAAALHLPAWITPVLLAGACVGLFYRIVTQLVDGAAGMLAAVLLISLSGFRWVSLVAVSHGAGLLFALAIFQTWLNWRASPTLWRVVLLSVLTGWYAITRPLDALCVTAPIAVAMGFQLWKQGARPLAFSAAIGVAALAPFLGLQLLFNRGVTGHWFTAPVSLYNAQHSPQIALGRIEVDPNFRPSSQLLQKQLLYARFVLPLDSALRREGLFRQAIHTRLPILLATTVPGALLLLLLPAGFLAWRDRRCWVLWAGLTAYLLAMLAFFAMLRQYCLLAIPAILLTILLGLRAVQKNWPDPFLRTALSLAVLGLGLAHWPELAGSDHNSYRAEWPMMAANYEWLPANVETPALVLFRYHPDSHFDEEPVYNLDAARPDDAPIIRAHDLGLPEDLKLFAYYAQHQPARTVYLFDRRTMKLDRAGNVKALYEKLSTMTPRPAPAPVHPPP